MNIKDQLYFGCAPKIIQRPYNFINRSWYFIFPKYRDNWAWNVRYWFNPRQKWIKKHIDYYPYCDKDKLIQDFLFGCVIDFVEEELCFERIDYEWHEEKQKFAKELRECYNYIKTERVKLDDDLTQAYNRVDKMNVAKLTYDDLYWEVNSLEEKIEKLDNKYLNWIVNNRNSLCT